MKIDDFLKEVSNSFEGSEKAYAVMLFTDTFEVVDYSEFGSMVDGKLNIEKLLDVRIFNEIEEYRLYRDYCGNDDYNYVHVSDEEMKKDKQTDVYDDEQYLDIDLKRTTEKLQADGYVLATGGGKYKFPIAIYGDMKIKIRNYVSYDENGQAYIKAWRLVGFGGEGEDKNVI